MRLTAPWPTGTTTTRTTRTTISDSGWSAPELCTLRLSNAEPANWPKTNEASSGSNTANIEWHLPAGTHGECWKVFFMKEMKTSNNCFNLTNTSYLQVKQMFYRPTGVGTAHLQHARAIHGAEPFGDLRVDRVLEGESCEEQQKCFLLHSGRILRRCHSPTGILSVCFSKWSF